MSKKHSQESSSMPNMNDDEIETLASQLEKMPMEDDADDRELILSYNDDLDLCLISYEPSKKINSLIQAVGRENSIKILTRCPRYNYACVALLNKSFHDLIRSGEIYKERSKNRVVEHWVYFSCNMLKWEAFDPVSKKWMRLPTINGDTCFACSDKESMGVGTNLLVIGKHVSGQAVYKYNLLTNSWSEGPTMSHPRCLFGSASLGTVAIFAGGVDPNGKIVDTVECYDNESGAWETLPSLLKPRKMSSGVFMDDKFYVIGGCGGKDMKEFSCGEEYDPVARTWRAVPDMWPGGCGDGLMAPPLLAVVDNELYAADCEVMEVKKYDKKVKVWESIGRLPEGADNMCGWGIAFRGCGDRVIIVGGRWAHGEYGYVEVYAWVPKEGPPQWTMMGRKKSYNFVYNCAIMGC